MSTRYEGAHDATSCLEVTGWARDIDGSTVSVEILADGARLAIVEASLFRPDLLAAGKGSGHHAFRFPLGLALHDGQPHEIGVRIAGSDFWLPGSPRAIACPHVLGDALPGGVKAESARRALLRPAEPADAGLRPFPMRIHLVCYEDLEEWILGKITRRLAQGLETLGMQVSIGAEPDPAADVNHHVIHWGYVDRKATLETVMVTHVDDGRELEKVRHQLVDVGVEMGLCMSFETLQRLELLGLPRERLGCIHPAHDGVIRPRPLSIGVTSRVYPDGCKREQLLAELAPLLPAGRFRFRIMGAGWEGVVARMRASGVEVEHHERFDYDAYTALIPQLDYYLYTGLDEGSIGLLDAVAAAVPTIATTQGFHLDVAGGITHGFRDGADLLRVFETIDAARRERERAVADWSWAEYARQHGLVWNHLMGRRSGRPPAPGLAAELARLGVVTGA